MKKIALFAAVLGCLAAASSLSAQVWSKKTKVTFSAPFQLPAAHIPAGVISMSPGTYVFRLADSNSERHMVQVTNVRGDKVYTTILAINDYRLNATSKTVMYFSERKAGAPMAVKSWFYPGDNFGQRFVYPKVKAAEIAVALNSPIPSYTPPPQEKAETIVVIKEVPIYIQTPAKEEVAYVPAKIDDKKDTAGEDGEAVKAAEPAATPLPKTASPIYAAGIMGSLLLGASLLFRRASSHLS